MRLWSNLGEAKTFSLIWKRGGTFHNPLAPKREGPLGSRLLVNLKVISPREIIERFRVKFAANDKG